MCWSFFSTVVHYRFTELQVEPWRQKGVVLVLYLLIILFVCYAVLCPASTQGASTLSINLGMPSLYSTSDSKIQLI
jgi:hypothetical protein